MMEHRMKEEKKRKKTKQEEKKMSGHGTYHHITN